MLFVGKRRIGIVVLCTVFLLAGVIGIQTGCQSKGDSPAFKPGTIYSRNASGEQIISHDAGNSYSLDKDGHVIISYNNGAAKVKAPLTLSPAGGDSETGMTVDETGFYISGGKTAIAYGGFHGEPVKVLISEDTGKSWNTYTVTKEMRGTTKYLGFMTKNDGWLVLSDFHGMGSEDHYIYKSADGGKTWTEVLGNANKVYARVLTGAGFANDDIGFLSFRYDFADFQPAICRTQDGGITWEKLHITLPGKYDEYNKTPLSPVFDKENGLFPIQLSKDGASNVVETIYLTSHDYGKTWTY